MTSLRAENTEVWAASPNLPLARFADGVRAIASTGLDLLEFGTNPNLTRQLIGFDSIISWYGANRPEFQECVKGLPFQFFTAIPPTDCTMHAADFFAAQVGASGPAIPRIECPRGDGGFAVLHPFSGSPKKCWPLARSRPLARLLQPH